MGQDTINYENDCLRGELDMTKMIGKTLAFLSKLQREEKNIRGPYGMRIVGYESLCCNLCYTGGLDEAVDGFILKFRREGWEHEPEFLKGWDAAAAQYKENGISGLSQGLWAIHKGAEDFTNER